MFCGIQIVLVKERGKTRSGSAMNKIERFLRSYLGNYSIQLDMAGSCHSDSEKYKYLEKKLLLNTRKSVAISV